MGGLWTWIVTISIVAFWTLLMFGCGGAPEGETVVEPDPEALSIEDIGKLEQALFLYTDYGQEQAGTQQRCSLPYSGGICAVPMRKTVYYYIYPWQDLGGCYGDFWNTSMQTAINGINAWNTSFATGFSFVPVAVNDSRLSLYMWCDAPWKDSTNSHMGSASPVAWGHCLDHGSDEVCKVGATWLRLSGNNIIEAAIAEGATATQQNRFIENTTRHELGHVMGLAHFPLGAQSGTLMAGATNSGIGNPKWNQVLSPSVYEASLVWGYCPDGNTASCE